MGLALAISRIYLPRPLRKSRLSELFRATAEAFQCQPPALTGLSLDRCLEEYALFTARNAERSMQASSAPEVRERLYHQAYRIGQNIRKELKVQTMGEVMLACGVIYKALKIEFLGNPDGNIKIRSCFFSSFYSSDVCRIISGLDEGLVAGLSGGLQLEFSQRITGGNPCCRAQLFPAGGPR